jgi:apoptosis-inducing factor 3
MNEQNAELVGPDLAQGIEIASVPDETMLLGHARGEAVLLVRRGHTIFALGATCTHYGAPLVDGLLVKDTVRCPWHHAYFSTTSGDALRAPAPVSCWPVEQHAGIAAGR